MDSVPRSASAAGAAAAARAEYEVLRYVDLNRWINADYGRLGEKFQAIVDAAFAPTGTSDANPVWFAFAAFASRGIGKAQLGAAIGLDAARCYRETGDSHAALAQWAPAHVAAAARQTVEKLVGEPARLAATFLFAFASALRHRGAFDGLAISALLDARTLGVSVERLVRLMRSAPGVDPMEHLAAVALTLQNTMEEGNRRIYTDIGRAGHTYLEFRASRGAAPSPREVVGEFSLPGIPGPEHAMRPYEFALAHLWDEPLPIAFERQFLDIVHDARPLVIAAFALYERAGATQDAAEKNRLIAFANNFVIFREQHQAVQPAFTPVTVLPGEVERIKLMEIITPLIEVELRLETWRFWQFAEQHLPRRGSNSLLSRAAEYNWGLFADRWIPVVDTYGPCYRNPRAMWPAPHPDPNEGI